MLKIGHLRLFISSYIIMLASTLVSSITDSNTISIGPMILTDSFGVKTIHPYIIKSSRLSD